MARKKRQEKPARKPTRRELSRWQQQQRRQRIVRIAGIAVIAVVVILALTGWYLNSYRPFHQTALKVNDVKFSMGYYADMLRAVSQGQPPENLRFMADAVVRDIQRTELIRQGAAGLGVTVSDKEIRDRLKESNLPVNDVYMDAVRGQLLLSKLQEDYFARQVPASAPQARVMAMLLESEDQAREAMAMLESGEDFSALAARLSLDPLTRTQRGQLGWKPKDLLTDLLGSDIPAGHAFAAEVGTLSQPLWDGEASKAVGYWLLRVVERKDDQSHLQALLLGSREDALRARERLVSGEDFATLARNLSHLDGADKNGGDLGFQTRETLNPVMAQYAFADNVTGELSQPLQDITITTSGGYWLINVLERADDRPLEEEDLAMLRTRALEDWATSLLTDPANRLDDYLDDDRKAWAMAQVRRR
ncbi:MAG: peptidylprolyl isomerase [Chloroflexi bacterium]|nr:peptidylprolyl isomerase [Chloroflexota bacterium]